jgi:hypothetical protein
MVQSTNGQDAALQFLKYQHKLEVDMMHRSNDGAVIAPGDFRKTWPLGELGKD